MTIYPLSFSLLRFRPVSAGAAVLLSAVVANATVYTWDPSGSAGVQAGDGTWDTTLTNWTTDGGSSNVAWVDGVVSSVASSAVFAGSDAGGIITLTGKRTIAVDGNSLSFLNSGYTLQSNNSTERIIEFRNSTQFLIAAGKSVTIGNKVTVQSAPIGGASGLANGTVHVDSGGKITSSGTISILGSGTTVNVKTGGAITVGGTVVVGNGTGDHTSLVVDGGAVTVTSTGQGNLAVNNGTGATNATSTVTLNSGSISLAGTTSRVLMGAANSSTVATTFNLNGGTITTSAVTDTTASVSAFNFNGGILKAGALANGLIVASAGNFMDALNNAVVKIGGAKVDSSGSDIKIAAALSHDVTLGATPDGGFEKLGSGTLTLTGTNTYTGDTTIEAGTLSVGSVYLNDASTVSIFEGAVFNLNFNGTDTIGGLSLGGVFMGDGSYGATGSGATFINDTYFTGGGVLAVVSTIPEPAAWASFAGFLSLSGAVFARRRNRARQG